ncbi:alpha-ketoglutarate-dependent dioxygenase AlkB [Pedobacter changchengzhani]|uniref:Alpha-ketoglutarate-dependent dioxygenase AlkB n=1 Tax=Pedobacter changchengzhani TaxID=2529274 RepID=A0A4R5MM49_9SPHI|nr:alpha-ketoglutarate-dependent dioxygenase AlkB [Pedobacter changchengzhani]TDG36732.1 alpha-ketoglutarate-dependent dioxygenase AlkB [Pedobacter changchengzhani]
MDLFNQEIDTTKNLLPYDGVVNYFGKIILQNEADHYFDELMNNIAWRNDEAFILGKHIITKRKVAWYANENYAYTYSKTTKHAIIWTPELLKLKNLVEAKTGEIFNSCLLNLYHNGNEGMAYHSDDEKPLQGKSSIASLSLGAERRFLFKNKKTKETITTFLEHGSLLVMKDSTQINWLHRLPTTTKVSTPRINLTFRTMVI